jgi:putative copper export protein/mono/diheme cytochrome c family protein
VTPVLIATVVRGVMLAATAVLLGALAVDVLVLPDTAPVPVRRRLRRCSLVAAAVLLLAAPAELLLRTQTMLGQSAGAPAGGVWLVVTRTHFGRIWLARCALTVAVGALALGHERRVRAAALVLGLGIALATALTGHLADWGDLTPTVGIDWAHVVAASVWTGGLAGLAVAGGRVSWPPGALGAAAGRFSRLAGLCLLAVLGTGAYNAWVQVSGLAALWTTRYGRVLVLKIIVVACLAMLGALTRYGVVAHLDRGRRRSAGARLLRRARLVLVGPSPGWRRRLPSRFVAYVTAETALALVVFACTAVLGESTPARHALHANHRHVVEPSGPVRTTMDALHASGGVPPGWLFTPPPGDPARGRVVYGRLQCYACHTIEGESFPRPTGAGPDLTAMGAHHPAGYLAESILNPNAVIVEGPGYTGPDGRSTMPDYRDSLSVADLVDLVAYLRTRRD